MSGPGRRPSAGTASPLRSESRWPWWHVITSIATPSVGVIVDFEVPAKESWEVYLVGESRGLPNRLSAVVAARDAEAAQIHGGDRVVAWRKVTLSPTPAQGAVDSASLTK